MENKYYTPETEEIHVFSEFEAQADDGEWYWSNTLKAINWDVFEKLISDSRIRIKYLDRSDIESLGFRQHGTDDRIYRNSDGIILNTGWGSPVIKDRFTTVITHQVFDESKLNVVHENFLFNGTIKNKSELKRLLKQLGI